MIFHLGHDRQVQTGTLALVHSKLKAITIAIQCMNYCTYVLSLHARYYHDRQLVDGVTASFWSKQTVECGKQFTGKSSASMCQVCNIFLHCTLYLVLITAHLFLELEEFASYLGRTDNPPSIIAHNRTTYFLNEYFAKVSLSLSSRMG